MRAIVGDGERDDERAQETRTLLDAIGAPAAVVRAGDLVVLVANAAWTGLHGAPDRPGSAMPEAARALARGEPARPLEVRALGPDRLLVVEHERPRLDDSPALDETLDDVELAQALVRHARAQGAIAAAVVARTPAGAEVLALAARADLEEDARRAVAGAAWPPVLPLAREPKAGPLVHRIWNRSPPRLALVAWAEPLFAARLDRLARRGAAHLARLRSIENAERVAHDARLRAGAFSSIVENVSEALWLTDRLGRILVANEAAADLLGACATHVHGLAALSHEGREPFAPLFEAIADGYPGEARVTLGTPGGPRRVELLANPTLDRLGGVDGFVISARDVTGDWLRMRALESLVQVAETATRPIAPAPLAQALVEQVRSGFALDAAAIWMAEAPGPHEPLPDAPVAACGSGAAALRAHRAFALAIEGDEPAIVSDGCGLTAAVVLHDGARRGVLALGSRAAAAPELELASHPQGLRVLARLASQALELARVRADAEDARRTLLAALSALPDAVLVAADDGRVARANAAARALFGDTAAIEGLGADELFATLALREPAGPALPGLVASALRGAALVADAITERNGEERSVTVHAIPLSDAAGLSLGAMVVAHDTTREREVERMKDTFLSMAAHELRTPLTAMKTWAQLSRRQLSRGHEPARVQHALERIDRQCDKMAALVNDLLDVSRLTFGRLPLRRTRIDAAALARALVEHLLPAITGHEVRFDAAEPVAVDADATRLEQVLTNLLTNAVKYSPEGRPVRVAVRSEGGEALLEVADEGCGIAPERLAHVFDRFYRAHEDRYAGGGLGLGLWIAREIVERHDGRIEAQSELGRGSVFRVRLPLAT